MKYAALILTFNRKEKLVGAIEALLKQNKLPEKIFVIDNCSTDGTDKLLREKGYLDNPLVDYTVLDKNYGGSGGFYYGIKKVLNDSQGKVDIDYLAISDDDAYYKPNYFSLIDQAVSNHPSCKAYCGTVQYKNGAIQTDHRRVVVNKKWLRQEEVPATDYQHDFYVDMFSFVGCVISLDILRKIGLPCKDYFINYDDSEYSLRIRQYTPILNISKAVIVHQILRKSDASTVIISWKNYYEIRNSILMKKAHSTWRFLSLYFWYHQIHLDLRILTESKFKGVRRNALYVYNRGFLDGIRGIRGLKAPFLPGMKLPY